MEMGTCSYMCIIYALHFVKYTCVRQHPLKLGRFEDCDMCTCGIQRILDSSLQFVYEECGGLRILVKYSNHYYKQK